MTPKVQYGDGFEILGTGTLLANGAGGHDGVIKNIASTTGTMEIKADVTLKGSLAIDCNANEGLLMDGTCLVDSGADEMIIGYDGFLKVVTGSGTFKVTAGSMIHDSGLAPDECFFGTYEVTGGIMTFELVLGPAIETNAFMRVSGGEMVFDRSWTSYGGYSISGGCITVKKSNAIKTVSFFGD